MTPEEIHAAVVEQLREIGRNYDAATAGLGALDKDPDADPWGAAEEALERLAGVGYMQDDMIDVALKAVRPLIHSVGGVPAGIAAIEEADAGRWLFPAILLRAVGPWPLGD